MCHLHVKRFLNTIMKLYWLRSLQCHSKTCTAQMCYWQIMLSESNTYSNLWSDVFLLSVWWHSRSSRRQLPSVDWAKKEAITIRPTQSAPSDEADGNVSIFQVFCYKPKEELNFWNADSGRIHLLWTFNVCPFNCCWAISLKTKTFCSVLNQVVTVVWYTLIQN